MRKKSATNRRQFLKNCLAGTVGIFAADRSAFSFAPAPLPDRISRVSIVLDPLLRGPISPQSSSTVISHGSTRLDANRVPRLLDAAMQGLFDSADPVRIWSSLVHPGQLVGLKVNTLGGRGLSTNVQLVDAICQRLQQAGIRPQDIVIWDRDTDELARAGFSIRVGGNQVQCYGTDRVGFEGNLSSYGNVGSQLSKILTRRCDAFINVPVLKDHDGAGVSIALKNMYGVIHNPNKYHLGGCNPYIADLNMLPEIRSKLRLHICDATNACFHGGPAFKPEFMWQANTLIVSTDPVALDHTGWQMIERKRAKQGLKSLEQEGRAPAYIATAGDTEHQLGTNDPKRIVLVEKRLA